MMKTEMGYNYTTLIVTANISVCISNIKLADLVISLKREVHSSDEKTNTGDLVCSPGLPELRGAHRSELRRAQLPQRQDWGYL